MKRVALSTICTLLFAVSTFAQVNARSQNQQDRIAQGVKSGQLTPGETANLESRERALNGEVRADRATNGGKLTAGERQQVSRRQNRLSTAVSQDKHNQATNHFGSSQVGQREKNQQERIGQGIQSGKLNAGQTARLEGRESDIQQEVKADRSANGGRLSAGERQQVNRQQNHASNAIYRDKH